MNARKIPDRLAMVIGKPLGRQTKPYKLWISLFKSPGDTCVVTMALASLNSQYPGDHLISFDGTAPELFYNNPYVLEQDRRDCYPIHIHNRFYETNKRIVHYAQLYCDVISEKIKKPLTLSVLKPDLYLSEQERNYSPPWQSPYVVLNAGYKADMPLKHAGKGIYQQVVYWLLERGITAVQIGSNKDLHSPLSGVVNLVGKTDVRQLMAIVAKASAGVGGVTFLQWLCAGLSVPYVSMGGGREPHFFHTTPKQISLHTIGQLPCCENGACWKAKPEDCPNMVKQPDGERVALCHSLIGAEGATQALNRILFGRNRAAPPKY